MALSHITKVYGTQMAKLYPITADIAGSATTYGAGVQLVGAKSLSLTLEIDAKEARGDNTLLDADAVLVGVKGSLKFVKANLDALAVLSGSTVTDTGTTPNQKSVWALKSADVPKFFKLDVQAVRSDPVGGDVHFILYKAKWAGLPLGFAEEDYFIHQLDFMAMPVLGTGLNWLDLVVNETAVAPA